MPPSIAVNAMATNECLQNFVILHPCAVCRACLDGAGEPPVPRLNGVSARKREAESHWGRDRFQIFLLPRILSRLFNFVPMSLFVKSSLSSAFFLLGLTASDSIVGRFGRLPLIDP